MNILLDYLFPITSVEAAPAASTAFLKQVLVVGKPKGGGVTPGVITACTTIGAVDLLVGADAKAECQKLFDAGMAKIYVMPNADLDIADELAGHEADFFTILIASDFVDGDLATADFGDFEGVVGYSSTVDATLTTWAATANRAGFHTTSANKAKNMFYAFGKLLSNSLNWRNQQYITMPVADDVATLGAAETLFDDKISFVISDDEYSNRLALFAAGGKAIVAPYIKRNLQIDMQAAAIQYISGNQPAYTKTEAALLEDELQKVVADYVDRRWLDAGTVSVELLQDNFVASGEINIAEPKALWRIFAEMRATL